MASAERNPHPPTGDVRSNEDGSLHISAHGVGFALKMAVKSETIREQDLHFSDEVSVPLHFDRGEQCRGLAPHPTFKASTLTKSSHGSFQKVSQLTAS